MLHHIVGIKRKQTYRVLINILKVILMPTLNAIELISFVMIFGGGITGVRIHRHYEC